MKNNKAFTLIELLVTMVIILVIGAAIYFTYDILLKGFKGESKNIESELENVVGLELLRLDIEHAGYGLAKDLSNKAIELNDTNKEIVIRSTLNNTNKSTLGYVIFNCPDISTELDAALNVDNREDPSITQFVLTNIDGLFKGFLSISANCPEKGYLIGFPVEFNGISPENGCGSTPPAPGEQFCNIIQYTLSSDQPLSTCNPNTYNLLRKAGGNALSGSGGEPLISCVADFVVRGKLEDGSIISDTTTLTASDIRNKLKQVNIYILRHEGRKDPKYHYNGSSITIDGITFDLSGISDYTHYRWKVLKITVNPMDL